MMVRRMNKMDLFLSMLQFCCMFSTVHVTSDEKDELTGIFTIGKRYNPLKSPLRSCLKHDLSGSLCSKYRLEKSLCEPWCFWLR